MSNRLEWVLKHNKENNGEYSNFAFTGKYLAIQKPNHLKARNDGYVYIHQLQAEKKLGRLLNDEECVHHIDENKYNNDIGNLMVFKTKSDHTAFHSGCEIYLDGDMWVAKINDSRICPICGEIKDYHADMCIKCYLNKKAKNIPEKETLIDLLLHCSMTQIGKKFNVTSNAVKKWCIKYGLPYKKNDINLFKIKMTV